MEDRKEIISGTGNGQHEGSPRKEKYVEEEDGRNKEWEDRARVNLEEVPEGTKTNIERDFEPETPAEEGQGKKQDETPY